MNSNHNKNQKISMINIRNSLNIGNEDLEYKWMTDVPYDVRQLAVKCFAGSFNSSLALKKNNHIKKFEHKYLTKKNDNVCYVNKKALSSDFKIFKRKLGKKDQLKFRKKMKTALSKISNNGDFPVIKDKSGRYYLCLVIKSENKSKNIESKDSIVALDPGVRTFQTYFSQHECGTIGSNISNQVKKIDEKIDKLESLKNTAKSKRKRGISRRCLLLRSKITNKVNDLHWKAAAFLTRRYKVIFLPTFNVKQMCLKNPNTKVNRSMYHLAHYKFKMRIKQKALLNGCSVIDCCEAYTSKTCTLCGVLNEVGSKKIYTCSSCGFSGDRDLNGARNIFIKSLTKYYTGLDAAQLGE